MAEFFIDVQDGRVATRTQLVEAGVTPPDEQQPRPWFRIQGTGDASTMWYAVLRKRTRGIVIGALALRHGDGYASLLAEGYEEVPVGEIGVEGPGIPA